MIENLDETTPRIERVLGVDLTVSEVISTLIQTNQTLAMQEPYLDARLLFRKERLEEALGDEFRITDTP